nr:MAG TPA: hypothetical protein [Bacteriophage sp.]
MSIYISLYNKLSQHSTEIYQRTEVVAIFLRIIPHRLEGVVVNLGYAGDGHPFAGGDLLRAHGLGSGDAKFLVHDSSVSLIYPFEESVHHQLELFLGVVYLQLGGAILFQSEGVSEGEVLVGMSWFVNINDNLLLVRATFKLILVDLRLGFLHHSAVLVNIPEDRGLDPHHCDTGELSVLDMLVNPIKDYLFFIGIGESLGELVEDIPVLEEVRNRIDDSFLGRWPLDRLESFLEVLLKLGSGRVELIPGLDKTEVACGDKLLHRETQSLVALGNRDDRLEVHLDELFSRLRGILNIKMIFVASVDTPYLVEIGLKGVILRGLFGEFTSKEPHSGEEGYVIGDCIDKSLVDDMFEARGLVGGVELLDEVNNLVLPFGNTMTHTLVLVDELGIRINKFVPSVFLSFGWGYRFFRHFRNFLCIYISQEEEIMLLTKKKYPGLGYLFSIHTLDKIFRSSVSVVVGLIFKQVLGDSLLGLVTDEVGETLHDLIDLPCDGESGPLHIGKGLIQTSLVGVTTDGHYQGVVSGLISPSHLQQTTEGLQLHPNTRAKGRVFLQPFFIHDRN